ncbi:antibiotic biosynthesis monooxygenase [Duganella sp. CY15W]|uniref:putative quinol monooxygenase n=1 Tax=Duganella sp. CY15W TaxID=2692172 RepID=UPI00136B1539|nr:antibiotic biosynthesis monooxygenase [Duganella sp. CY15W]MYM29308.1 antibiotic biosynthesis monooxygenase [Duganella sp. CY15W]
MTEQSTNAPASPSTPDANAFFIKFKVKLGRNADFERAMEDMIAEVRKQEPGNIYCDLLRSSRDAQTYSIMERFLDSEAVKRHAESSYIKKLGDIFQQRDVLEGAPEIQELTYIQPE